MPEGTDFPPVIEAFAKRQALGQSGGLRPITVAHEITAVAMAHGYAPAALARGFDVVRPERRQALLIVIAR